MPRFRKKPVIIDAVQLSWKTLEDVRQFLGGIPSERIRLNSPACISPCGETAPYLEILVDVYGLPRLVRHGEWIVRHSDGRLEVMGPFIFAALYDLVGEPCLSLVRSA